MRVKSGSRLPYNSNSLIVFYTYKYLPSSGCMYVIFIYDICVCRLRRHRILYGGMASTLELADLVIYSCGAKTAGRAYKCRFDFLVIKTEPMLCTKVCSLLLLLISQTRSVGAWVYICMLLVMCRNVSICVISM